MDNEIKNILLEIQCEIKDMNNKIEEINKKSNNGNYIYSDTNHK